MKKVRLWSLALAGFVSLVTSARAASFADVQFWVGSGANQAALVLDWNDGKNAESLLWGFRWNGTATGLDLFKAVVAADPRLYANISPVGPFGVSIYGIGYDLNGNNSFGVSPTLSFDAGGLTVGTPDDSRAPTEAGDHWREGWNFGFWGYNVKATGSAAWASAFFGPGDRVLTDGAWDGYSFAPDFNSFTDPSEPLAATIVPEPTALALLSSAAIFLTCVRRKQS